MSPSADPPRQLAALFKRLRSRHGEPQPESALPPGLDDLYDPLVHLFVYSFLLWDSSASAARSLLKKIRENFVDYNELRVALPDEIALVFGERTSRCHERALRLRSALHDLFKREHSLSLARLNDLGKREARAYLESLDGTPAYVSARVFLLGLGGHAIPVDQRLADLLAAEDVLSEDVTDADSAAAWLERQIRAGDAVTSHLLFQAWSDDEGSNPRRDRRLVGPDFLPEPVAPPPAEPTSLDTRADTKPETRPEARPESKSDPRPDPRPEGRAENRADPKADKPDSKSSKADAPRKSKSAPKPKPDTKSDSKPESKPKPAKPKPDSSRPARS